MRISHLTIAGFGPYKNEQQVDFEQFRDDGLFLITGKTGAGKSSILDAICYALYGSIPRYDNAQQKLRSDYCAPDDPTFVELVFSVNGIEYRVRRTPEFERPKKGKAAGTTVQKPTAELAQRIEATDESERSWLGLAARPVDVGHHLDRILGLSKDQFLQVILLAQNRFQEFLLAKNDDRQAVLRSLFGTRRFEHIETSLVERRKVLGTQLESGREKLAQQAAVTSSLLGTDEPSGTPDLAWFEAALATIDAQLGEARDQAAVADATFDAADADLRALLDVQRLQARRDTAIAALSALEAEHDAIEFDRAAMADARRAAVVWPQIVAEQNAQTALEAALSAEESARDEFQLEAVASLATEPATGPTTDLTTDLTTDPTTDPARSLDALDATIGELTRTLGTLDAVLAEERRLPGLVQELQTLQQRVSECDEAVEHALVRSQALPSQIDAISAALTEAQVQAAAALPAAEHVNRLTDARRAAVSAQALEAQYRDNLAAETEVSGAHSAASALIHDLMRRRLAGHAAELAADLQPGQACAVCGSIAHPEPAAAQTDPITADDIEQARDAADVRRHEMDAAHERVLSTATALAHAQTGAAGKSVFELDADLEDARTALAVATDAAQRVADLEAQRALLRGELESSTARLVELRAERDAAALQAADVAHSCADIEKQVATHRGNCESVSERAAALQRSLDTATRLQTAIRQVQTAQNTRTLATAALTEQLTEQGFATVDDASDARRAQADIAALDARIRLHDQALSTAQATLAEPEIVALDATPVDVSEATAHRAEARAARDAALTEMSVLSERANQLHHIVESVRAESAASASAHEEYAQLHELASVIGGKDPNTKRMRLETYVLAAQLEEIVAAANTRLRAMTSGRYALEHDDSVQYRNTQSGLGLVILDQHTGRARATNSLSGGETFLASLALALGLAEVVTNQAGGITLDTLFVDEGFGSLDSDTLEIAMGTLDSLRSGGRTIGLISHVDAMKEQIPAKLRISVTDRGYSEIETEPAFA